MSHINYFLNSMPIFWLVLGIVFFLLGYFYAKALWATFRHQLWLEEEERTRLTLQRDQLFAAAEAAAQPREWVPPSRKQKVPDEAHGVATSSRDSNPLKPSSLFSKDTNSTELEHTTGAVNKATSQHVLDSRWATVKDQHPAKEGVTTAERRAETITGKSVKTVTDKLAAENVETSPNTVKPGNFGKGIAALGAAAVVGGSAVAHSRSKTTAEELAKTDKPVADLRMPNVNSDSNSNHASNGNANSLAESMDGTAKALPPLRPSSPARPNSYTNYAQDTTSSKLTKLADATAASTADTVGKVAASGAAASVAAAVATAAVAKTSSLIADSVDTTSQQSTTRVPVPTTPAVPEKTKAITIYKPSDNDPDRHLLSTDGKLGPVYRSKPTIVDDLTAIDGIGPGLADRLNRLGIYRVSQIADWTPEVVAEFDRRLAFSGYIDKNLWLPKAGALRNGYTLPATSTAYGATTSEIPKIAVAATSNVTSVSRDRVSNLVNAETTTRDPELRLAHADEVLGTVYRSRPASVDDLTKIFGIGEELAEKLNRLGIYRVSQIAAWTPRVVREFDRRLAFIGYIDAQRWVPQAKQLAKQAAT